MKRSKEKAEELLGVSGFHRLQNELTKETVNHPEHYLGNKFEAIEEAYDHWFKNSDKLINSDRAHDFAIAAVGCFHEH